MRHRDPHALEPLEPVLEHRPVRLAQDIEPEVHHEIRADAQDVAIEGRMVELAERDAIGDDGFSPRVAVWQGVGRLEQLPVSKPADRASLLIRPQHPLPEHLLVRVTSWPESSAPRVGPARAGAAGAGRMPEDVAETPVRAAGRAGEPRWFVSIVANEPVVELVAFGTTDPAVPSEMTRRLAARPGRPVAR